MRAHCVHDRVNASLLTVHYVATQDNAANALAKGLGATSHRKTRLLLCVTEQEPSSISTKGTCVSHCT
eukprot:12904649-Prorocentrum_lima.AAC.1